MHTDIIAHTQTTDPQAELAIYQRMLDAAWQQHAQGTSREDRLFAIDWMVYAAERVIGLQRIISQEVTR